MKKAELKKSHKVVKILKPVPRKIQERKKSYHFQNLNCFIFYRINFITSFLTAGGGVGDGEQLLFSLADTKCMFAKIILTLPLF